ncbi:hypothetical protein ABLA30_07675 [Xenorhabdus nematophila]|uniref:hypothetical protein n=1 Tax=Xenorhabdus nematophila TaxID=628 RepID=UPI0032B7EA3E
MRLLTQILFFACIFSLSPPSIAGLSTATEIMQQVQERGVNSVVAELGADHEQKKVTDNIASGNSEWLQLAFKLLPNIHSKFSKQTLESLTLALLNNPVEVLSLTKKHHTLAFSDICNIPSTITAITQQKLFLNSVISRLDLEKELNFGNTRENIETCRWEFEKIQNHYF